MFLCRTPGSRTSLKTLKECTNWGRTTPGSRGNQLYSSRLPGGSPKINVEGLGICTIKDRSRKGNTHALSLERLRSRCVYFSNCMCHSCTYTNILQVAKCSWVSVRKVSVEHCFPVQYLANIGLRHWKRQLGLWKLSLRKLLGQYSALRRAQRFKALYSPIVFQGCHYYAWLW